MKDSDMNDVTISSAPIVAMIVAMAKNRVIGIDNKLPWHIPEDLQFFKAVTMGKPIIMGRKTFESIGRPLPGRLNIVITRNSQWRHDEVRSCTSCESAIKLAKAHAIDQDLDEIMVIGGEQIYRELLPLSAKLYVTEVDTELLGDAFFPELDEAQWRRNVVTPAQAGKSDLPVYQFVEYTRKYLQ